MIEEEAQEAAKTRQARLVSEFMKCDHENRCCSLHRIHVVPHQGCILR